MEYFIGAQKNNNKKMWQLFFRSFSASSFCISSCHFILFYFRFTSFSPWIWLIKNDTYYGCVCVFVCREYNNILYTYIICVHTFFPAYFIYWNGNVLLAHALFHRQRTALTKRRRRKNTLRSHAFLYSTTYQTNNAWYKYK